MIVKLFWLIVFAIAFMFGPIALLLAAPMGGPKIVGLFVWLLVALYAIKFLWRTPSSKKLMHHADMEELSVAKQMFERGDISQEQYEEARAELMAKLD